MVLIGYSHLVSYGNLFFTRSGSPLNLTIGQKNADGKCVCLYLSMQTTGLLFIRFCRFLVFADLDSEVIRAG